MGHVQERCEVRVVAVREQLAVARDQVDEALERGLDRTHVLENVRVIKFQVVDDRDFRPVMNELASLVEERGVVLVALDDEPFAVGEPRAFAELCGMPPIRKLGFSPLCSKTHVSSEVVVVFPCVPLTTSERFPRMKYSFSNSGGEQ